jgi:hypothetical protein
MKPAYWLVALLVLAGAWWLAGHPGYEAPEQRLARVEARVQAAEAAKPRLYRWRDGNGVLQVTDKPPKGRKYTVVDTAAAENLNLIPMSEAIAPTEPKAEPDQR